MKGFKGFDKNFKCHTFQFEIGKTYKHEGDISLCSQGFHFCENPLHVFRYYSPVSSRFAEIEADGVSDQKESDSKRVAKSLKIVAEFDLKTFLGEAFKFIFERKKFKNAPAQAHGDCSAAQAHGDCSAAQAHGSYSAAQAHGYCSTAQTHGESSAAQAHGDCSVAQAHGSYSAAQAHGSYSTAQTHGKSSAAQAHGYCSAVQAHGESSAAQAHGDCSVAVALGPHSKVAGKMGNWITVDEWEDDERINVKTVRVDGRHIKANIFYTLKNGKFVEAK